ncbi:uncharacterized protein LOC142348415 isoform X2 [Convolutriloba macropyga]
MTIRLGKALYYCQKCWKASKENKSASTFAGQRKASVPKVAPPKVAPKPVVKPIQETPINKPNPAATNNQLPQNRPEQEPAKLKPEPTVQTVEVTPKAQEAENKEEELKPLAPSVPASVTTAAMKADDTAEDLADSAAKQLNLNTDKPAISMDVKNDKEKDCFICEMPAASGTYYTCGEWQYHEKCITCNRCGRKDREKWDDCVIFPNEEGEGKGVKFFCKDCNLANAPVCVKCQKPIIDGVLTLNNPTSGKDMQYHADCLNCGLCDKNMARGEELMFVNGQLNCSECRMKNSITCRRCNQVIMGPYNSIAGDTEGSKFNYHATCFMCILCGKDLNSSDLGGKTEVNGKNEVYCMECHLEKFCEKCARCSKPLIGEFFRLGGEKICKECCRCVTCNNYIGGKFKMTPEGKFQCMSQECPANRADS